METRWVCKKPCRNITPYVSHQLAETDGDVLTFCVCFLFGFFPTQFFFGDVDVKGGDITK